MGRDGGYSQLLSEGKIMPFITYRDDSKLIDQTWPAQTAANSHATSTAGVSAHQGEIVTATQRGTAVNGLNIEGTAGWYLHSDGTVHDEPPITDTIRLRRAFSTLHLFYEAERDEIEALRRYFPSVITQLLEDEGVHLHEGAYAVAHSAAYSVAQKVAFAQNSLMGATDAVNGRALLIYLETAHRAGRSVVIPDVPIVTVNPVNGTRLTVVQSLSTSTTLNLTKPAPGALIGGAWLKTLTA